MKSYDLVDFGAPLQVSEKPTPKPQGSEVLLRTLAAGVCHSDLHIWDGWYDLGGGKKLVVKDRGMVPPLTMGHEIVGEVVAVGSEATGTKSATSAWRIPGSVVAHAPSAGAARSNSVQPLVSWAPFGPAGMPIMFWCRTRATYSSSASSARPRRRPTPVRASPLTAP